MSLCIVQINLYFTADYLQAETILMLFSKLLQNQMKMNFWHEQIKLSSLSSLSISLSNNITLEGVEALLDGIDEIDAEDDDG